MIFVGGPLDGMTKDVDASLGVFEVPLETPDGLVIHHRYGQAELVDPAEPAATPNGDRRYKYLGEARQF